MIKPKLTLFSRDDCLEPHLIEGAQTVLEIFKEEGRGKIETGVFEGLLENGEIGEIIERNLIEKFDTEKVRWEIKIDKNFHKEKVLTRTQLTEFREDGKARVELQSASIRYGVDDRPNEFT